jgi:hypothetical protein
METITCQNNSLTLDVYQTDDLRKWIGIYLHACRSQNLAMGTIEFYDKKLTAFVQFGLKHAITNISQIKPDHIRVDAPFVPLEPASIEDVEKMSRHAQCAFAAIRKSGWGSKVFRLRHWCTQHRLSRPTRPIPNSELSQKTHL